MESIVINDKMIQYKLIKERRKSLTLRFENDELVVKVPAYISKKEIEAFILKHAAYITHYLSSYNQYYSIEDQYAFIFNQRYDLKYYDLSKNKCVIHDQEIYVYSKNIEKALNNFFKEELYSYCSKKIDEYLSTFDSLTKPDITIKKYTGRWGSCYYKESRVSFNKSLIHLDPYLIDYVIVHELCHFLEPNHSKNFYKEIEKRLPDYKKRIKLLKEKHV